mgnify:CR=1 FL=1
MKISEILKISQQFRLRYFLQRIKKEIFYSTVIITMNKQEFKGQSAGNTFVEYEPAHDNSYYFLQENTPIYLDSDGKSTS